MRAEAKVIYEDEGRVRAIRGIVERDPLWPDFVVIHRRDGIVRLREDTVIRIEEWNGEGENRDESKRAELSTT